MFYANFHIVSLLNIFLLIPNIPTYGLYHYVSWNIHKMLWILLINSYSLHLKSTIISDSFLEYRKLVETSLSFLSQLTNKLKQAALSQIF